MEMAEEDKIAEQELLEKALRRENQSLLKEHRAQEARDAAVTASRVSEVRESLARAAVTWKGNAEADAVRQVLLTAGAVSVRLEADAKSATASFDNRQKMLEVLLTARQSPLNVNGTKLRLKPMDNEAAPQDRDAVDPSGRAEDTNASDSTAGAGGSTQLADAEARMLAALKARASLRQAKQDAVG